MFSPTEKIPPELNQRIRSVLCEFLTDTELSTVRMRDVLVADYDSQIIRFNTDKNQYYLVESDHIENDDAYRIIAKVNGQDIVRKVTMRPEAVPLYPQRTPEMQHNFADKSTEWAFVFEDKISHRLYCLFEVR